MEIVIIEQNTGRLVKAFNAGQFITTDLHNARRFESMEEAHQYIRTFNANAHPNVIFTPVKIGSSMGPDFVEVAPGTHRFVG